MILLSAARSLLFLIIFYPGTLLISIGGIPFALAGRDRMRRYTMGWVAFHGWCERWLLGIRTRIEGPVPAGPVLVAAKHQSLLDPPALVRILNGPAVVMKEQLERVPIWGWLAKSYGNISIDRSAGASALRRMVREAAQAPREGRSVLIFPEGTRVHLGEQPPLQPGFAGLYRALGLPVVPVALDTGRVWPRRGWIRRSGTATYLFGEPLPPGLPRDELERRIHAAINRLEYPS